jgi:hypothetical protein
LYPYYVIVGIKCEQKKEKICIMQIGSKKMELAERQTSMGGNGNGVYKHSAGENWASEVSR